MAAWIELDVLQFPISKMIVAGASFYVKHWPANSGPMPGEIHSVSISRAEVKGGKNKKEPTLTAYLDGPAKPGGQRVYVSTDNNSLAWLLVPSTNYFDTPAGQQSGGWSWFLGNKNVLTNRSVNVIVNINGRK